MAFVSEVSRLAKPAAARRRVNSNRTRRSLFAASSSFFSYIQQTARTGCYDSKQSKKSASSRKIRNETVGAPKLPNDALFAFNYFSAVSRLNLF